MEIIHIAMETLLLTLSRWNRLQALPVSLSNIVVGCGHNNAGTFNNKGSGIVGFGRGEASLVSQLGSSIGKLIVLKC
jgi:hypothetical protein